MLIIFFHSQVVLATSQSLADIEKEIKEEIEFSDSKKPIKGNILPKQSIKIFENTNDLVDPQNKFPNLINIVASENTSDVSGTFLNSKKVSNDSLDPSQNFLSLVDKLSQKNNSNCNLSENSNTQKVSDDLYVASPQKKRLVSHDN